MIVRAAEQSNEDHAKDMAASIAFFGFFSLFPLRVGVVAGASFFIDRDKIESHLDRMLASEFPGSADFLRTNLEALTDLRGAAGVASVVGLLWSASKMVGALSRGMNLALDIPKGQPFYVSKLRYFAMTIIVSLVLFLAVGGSMALDVFTQIDLMRFGLDSTVFDSIWSHLTSFVFIFATLLLLYKIVPYKRSPWRELLPGGLHAKAVSGPGRPRAGFRASLRIAGPLLGDVADARADPGRGIVVQLDLGLGEPPSRQGDHRPARRARVGCDRALRALGRESHLAAAALGDPTEGPASAAEG